MNNRSGLLNNIDRALKEPITMEQRKTWENLYDYIKDKDNVYHTVDEGLEENDHIKKNTNGLDKVVIKSNFLTVADSETEGFTCSLNPNHVVYVLKEITVDHLDSEVPGCIVKLSDGSTVTVFGDQYEVLTKIAEFKKWDVLYNTFKIKLFNNIFI